MLLVPITLSLFLSSVACKFLLVSTNFARSGDIDADGTCFPGLEVVLVLLFLSFVAGDSMMPSSSMMNPSPRPLVFFPYKTIPHARGIRPGCSIGKASVSKDVHVSEIMSAERKIRIAPE
jgi:hypothetical protein